MPLPARWRSLGQRIEQFVADHEGQLAAYQDGYQAKHGRYWQGLRTPATVPRDGERVEPDLTRRPTDQDEDWQAFGWELPDRLLAPVRVDAYDGPEGQGYVLRLRINLDGMDYARSWGHGPEADANTTSWYADPPEE